MFAMLSLCQVITIIAGLMLSAPQPEYEPYLNRTFYTIQTVVTDNANRSRRLIVKASYKGRRYAGSFDVAVSLEINSMPGPYRTMNAPFAVTCDGRHISSRNILHSLDALDVESAAATTAMSGEELKALVRCDRPGLTIGGIPVTLPRPARTQIQLLIASLR